MELDQFRDVDLVIDYANFTFIEKQFVSQGDYKGRTLTVQVTNNGVVGEVPGLMLHLNWHNQASGLTDLSAFSVLDKANSIYRIEYPQHMMTPGKVLASIQVIQNGKVTNLKQFELTVQKLAGQPVGIVEKAEFSALVAILADSNKFRTDIDRKADKAFVDAQLAQKAKQSTADNLQSQINNIVLDGTAGDSSAEVSQSKIDINNNTFLTIKGRFDNIEKTLYSENLKNTVLWNVGVNSAGRYYPNFTEKICNKNVNYADEDIYIGFKTRGVYMVIVDYYSDISTYSYSSDWIRTDFYKIPKGTYYKLNLSLIISTTTEISNPYYNELYNDFYMVSETALNNHYSMNNKEVKEIGNCSESYTSYITNDYVYIPLQYRIPYGGVIKKVQIATSKALTANNDITIWILQKSLNKYNVLKSFSFDSKTINNSGIFDLFINYEAEYSCFIGISTSQAGTVRFNYEASLAKYNRVQGTVANFQDNGYVNEPTKVNGYNEIIKVSYLVPASDYNDIRLCIVGDSLQSDYTHHADYHWYDYLSQKTGMRFWSYGVGATGFTVSNGLKTRTYEQIQNINVDPTHIIIWSGTNDYGVNKTLPLGTVNDPAGDTTVYAAIKLSINVALELFPNAKIGFVTPVPRADGVSNFTNARYVNNTLGFSLNDVSEAIKNAADLYNIPVYDACKMSNLRPWIDANNAQYYNNDRLHPNSVGQKMLYDTVKDFVLGL
ncbi:SGNH/GDSL hydrolase family protein [Enterococcus casseliflavus]|uniref:SGNH/GDSL hydrolase family protein n=1 Tax=Enterococcus casseliflavus TaxID=37734 RepID=UPI0039A45703